MRQVLLGTATIGLLVLLAGLPWAAALRRRADGWVALLVDAALLGLVWLPLGIVAWGWLGWAGLVGTVAVWAVGAVVAVRRRSWPASRLRRLTGAETALGLGWLAVLGISLAVRLREVNFLPWIGDMGGYVNWANEFARTGELDASWPPFFPAYLSIGTGLFGPRHTTVGMALTGLVLVVGVARLVQQVTGARWAALGAGASLAVQVHAVWYSSFPASESLNAPVFVLWVLLVHRVLVGGGSRPALLVGVGTTMAALGLLRGSAGVLLVLLLLLLAVVAAVRAWRPLLRPTWGVLAASVVGFVVSYWYGITEIHRYYVRMQLRPQLPRPARQLADWAGVFDPTVRTAVLLVLVVVGVVLADVLVGRRGPADGERSVPAARGGAVVLVVAAAAWAGTVAWQVAVDGEVGAILVRMGLPLVLGAALALVAVLTGADAPARLTMLLLAASVVSFALFHVVRLGSAREHAFHLYWDRYLVSEVLPAVAAMTWVGLAAVVGALVRRVTARGPRIALTAASATAGVAVLAAVVVPSVPQVRLATQDVFLRGAFDITEQLAEKVGQDMPAVWSADSRATLEGWEFFPNTWMAFAVPLHYTWGIDVVNAERGVTKDFAGDDVVEADVVPFAAACAGIDEFVLLDIDKGGPDADHRLADPRLDVERLGMVGGLVSLLPQRDDAEWTSVHVEVDAWHVTVRPEARISSPACWITATGGSGTRMQTK